MEQVPLFERLGGRDGVHQLVHQVTDDIVAAMESEGIGELEQAEVLKILWGMKGDVVRL